VLPVDAWSRVTGTRWSFGDGTSARGAWVEHVYSAPGRYTVRVTSVDALGLRTTASQSILVTSY
jgi:chitodextrinase